ncbi:uncharacterized protein N7477_003054 [Penicillium maclennaniae]|uniref:uncharacterized protein n=1 Tax=Penicillium maclennaniae TaxID=1343394 RepID=UPI0025422EF0|nr:uncharacterized protein N7477_003054 [Penicillium maclennaniae]KAJ5677421.1 hypothetical protein N7477_003054 [Penicillium maclennaniae]
MAPLSKIALVTLGVINGANAWGVWATRPWHILPNITFPRTLQHGVLGDTSTSYLANIASWADTYRTTTAGKWSAPLHFIDAEDDPPTTCNVNYERDCGSTGCSISAIANYTQRAGDGRLTSDHVAEAVKFLVHFLGDVTQPLHDEAYEVGGNDIKVTFNGYSDNLHSDWDTYMPEQLIGGYSLSDAQSWANSLISEITSGSYKSQAASWVAGDTISDPITSATRWASDANAFVCTVVMPNGAAALQTGDLYPTYYDSVIDTIELQIAKGGYRLGNWLNMIYSSEIAKRDLEDFVKQDQGTDSGPDLMGRDLLPEPRPLTRAKLARAAMDGSCCSSGEHDHAH